MSQLCISRWGANRATRSAHREPRFSRSETYHRQLPISAFSCVTQWSDVSFPFGARALAFNRKEPFPKLNEFLCYQNLCSSAVCVKKRAGERLNLVLLLRLYKREREREGRKRASQPWLEADNIRHSLASKRTVTITPAVRYRKHFD